MRKAAFTAIALIVAVVVVAIITIGHSNAVPSRVTRAEALAIAE